MHFTFLIKYIIFRHFTFTMESSGDFLQKKIIIIGAGVSGLVCASRLRDYGFENVSILEARSRIGGRTHTVFYKTDPTCDEGIVCFKNIFSQFYMIFLVFFMNTRIYYKIIRAVHSKC